MMKRTAMAVAVAALFNTSAYAAAFVNGGFDAGDLSGWTQGGGYWGANLGSVYVPLNNPPGDTGAALPQAPAYAGGTSNNTIMSGGVDPITGANRVFTGSHSVRVNDSNNNWSVSTLSQTVANYTDQFIYFAWNAVLESSHDLDDSDYFSLTLYNETTGTTVLNRSYSSAGSVGGGTSGVTWSTFGNWFSSGWVTESIDLQALGMVGDDFTLSLLASDCPYGGHAGYVYLDGFGGQPPTPTPEPASLALLGLGLAGLAAARRRRKAAS